MSDFERTANGFTVAASVTKITNKATKGGVLQLTVETPLKGAIAAAVLEHVDKAGLITFEYVDKQQKLDFEEGVGPGKKYKPGVIEEEEEYEEESVNGSFDDEEWGEPMMNNEEMKGDVVSSGEAL